MTQPSGITNPVVVMVSMAFTVQSNIDNSGASAQVTLVGSQS